MRPVAPVSNALVDMLLKDQENGVNPVEIPPPPGPLVKNPPMIPPVIPPPDWRAEEEDRARRKRPIATPAEVAIEDEPKRKTTTPNLDTVRAWSAKGAP